MLVINVMKIKQCKWSDEYITKWYGEKRKPHFGTTFTEGREAKPEALKDLIRIDQRWLVSCQSLELQRFHFYKIILLKRAMML